MLAINVEQERVRNSLWTLPGKLVVVNSNFAFELAQQNPIFIKFFSFKPSCGKPYVELLPKNWYQLTQKDSKVHQMQLQQPLHFSPMLKFCQKNTNLDYLVLLLFKELSNKFLFPKFGGILTEEGEKRSAILVFQPTILLMQFLFKMQQPYIQRHPLVGQAQKFGAEKQKISKHTSKSTQDSHRCFVFMGNKNYQQQAHWRKIYDRDTKSEVRLPLYFEEKVEYEQKEIKQERNIPIDLELKLQQIWNVKLQNNQEISCEQSLDQQQFSSIHYHYIEDYSYLRIEKKDTKDNPIQQCSQSSIKQGDFQFLNSEFDNSLVQICKFLSSSAKSEGQLSVEPHSQNMSSWNIVNLQSKQYLLQKLQADSQICINQCNHGLCQNRQIFRHHICHSCPKLQDSFSNLNQVKNRQNVSKNTPQVGKQIFLHKIIQKNGVKLILINSLNWNLKYHNLLPRSELLLLQLNSIYNAASILCQHEKNVPIKNPKGYRTLNAMVREDQAKRIQQKEQLKLRKQASKHKEKRVTFMRKERIEQTQL